MNVASPIAGTAYSVTKGDVRLALWRKRAANASADRGVLVLVHGSSLAARPTFDLEVPERPDYSMMDWFALRGYDVWTLDHEGYGESTDTGSNSDVATGVADLAAAAPVILRQSGSERFALYGMSSGSLRAGAFAGTHPQFVERLVLDAFVWTGEGSQTLAERRKGLERFRASNRRDVDEDFLIGIFTRDRPGTTDPDVARACARAQLRYGSSVPTGTYVDMLEKLPLVDPAAIPHPTLIVRGEYDGLATDDDLIAFFKRLPTGDKTYAVLPGLAHATTLGIERHRMWRTVDAFLARDRD